MLKARKLKLPGVSGRRSTPGVFRNALLSADMKRIAALSYVVARVFKVADSVSFWSRICVKASEANITNSTFAYFMRGFFLLYSIRTFHSGLLLSGTPSKRLATN
jgi:hypothetical protein